MLPSFWPQPESRLKRTVKAFHVYILASRRNGTLYIGVISNLIARVWQHKNNVNEGFTQRYNVHSLVYYKPCMDATSAIQREKQLKNLHRRQKLTLIERMNPDWKDLYEEIA